MFYIRENYIKCLKDWDENVGVYEGVKKKIEFILIILNVKKRDNDYYKVKNNGLFFNDFYILGNYNF